MQKFDPHAAMCGAKVCTRDGRPARILCFDLKDRLNPVVVAVLREDLTECILCYSIHGLLNRFDFGIDNPDDLMMADDDYLEKLERGEYKHLVAVDPWGDFKREAALEMLRQRRGFFGDIVSSIIEDVNRLTEGLIQGNNVNNMDGDE